MTARRGDGLGAIYSELLAVAARMDRAIPGSGDGLRDDAEDALRAIMAARRTTSTSTTTSGRAPADRPPYARRHARG